MRSSRNKAAWMVVLVGTWPVGAGAQTGVRIATWNVQTVGVPVSTQYQAALAVLNRIGADVVAINEVLDNGDIPNFLNLAADAGYPHVVVPNTNPLGDMRNAFLSKFAFVGNPIIHTSAELSGDSNANDITRLIIEIVVDVPANAKDLTLVVEHWKASGGDNNEFRRAVESFRVAQSLDGLNRLSDAYVVMGDFNEEISAVPREPNPFTSLPSGLPGSFDLGADLVAELSGPGIVNDPFYYVQRNSGPDVSALSALQLDGSDITHPGTGRRIDYILLSQATAALGPAGEVYDSADESIGGGLPKFGLPLPPNTSLDAADHYLVFADITVPSAGPCTTPDDCDDGVFCNGLEDCVNGDCQTGTPPSCDDGVACTTDSCDVQSDFCLNVPVDSFCADGDVCNGVESCSLLLGCLPGAPPQCDDFNVCTDDSCDAVAGCQHVGNTAPCQDGTFCNGVDTCMNGSCSQHSGDPCPDYCDEQGDTCVECLNDEHCSDGAFCNGDERCVNGVCLPALSEPDCDDGVQCTVDSCDEVFDQCDNIPDDAVCDDGDFCNGSETCSLGIGCLNGFPPQCDDGLFCNGVETCADNACQAGKDPCPGQVCVEETRECAGCRVDADCDDGDVCNGDETCDTDTGQCLDGSPLECDDGDDCNGLEFCDSQAGGCVSGEIDDCDGNGRSDVCDLADCLNDPSCADCNDNGMLDGCDIAGGEPDVNENGVPDVCDSLCETNADCAGAEADPCTFDLCVGNACVWTDALYGDTTGAGGACGPDGVVDLFDILAVLNAFQGMFEAPCEFANVNIAGSEGSCTPDGTIDLSDILAVLDAFQGVDRCCALNR